MRNLLVVKWGRWWWLGLSAQVFTVGGTVSVKAFWADYSEQIDIRLQLLHPLQARFINIQKYKPIYEQPKIALTALIHLSGVTMHHPKNPPKTVALVKFIFEKKQYLTDKFLVKGFYSVWELTFSIIRPSMIVNPPFRQTQWFQI